MMGAGSSNLDLLLPLNLEKPEIPMTLCIHVLLQDSYTPDIFRPVAVFGQSSYASCKCNDLTAFELEKKIIS